MEEMPFKDISYLELWQACSSAEQNHLCNFCRGYYEDQFYEIILNFGQWVRRRCCSVERNHSCNFDREHSCEVI